MSVRAIRITVITCALLCTLAWIALGWYWQSSWQAAQPWRDAGDYAAAAASQVHEGLLLSDGVQALETADGYLCRKVYGPSTDPRSGKVFTTQHFFYGSRDYPEAADVVWLRADGLPGEVRITETARISGDDRRARVGTGPDCLR